METVENRTFSALRLALWAVPLLGKVESTTAMYHWKPAGISREPCKDRTSSCRVKCLNSMWWRLSLSSSFLREVFRRYWNLTLKWKLKAFQCTIRKQWFQVTEYHIATRHCQQWKQAGALPWQRMNLNLGMNAFGLRLQTRKSGFNKIRNSSFEGKLHTGFLANSFSHHEPMLPISFWERTPIFVRSIHPTMWTASADTCHWQAGQIFHGFK